MLKLLCASHTSSPCTPILSQPNLHLPLQAHNKKPVKTLGAGPLLPNVRGIHGIPEKALMPFVKKLKQPKHLDALQPSSYMGDSIVLPLGEVEEIEAKTLAWDDYADTLLEEEEAGHARVIGACTQDPIEVCQPYYL